jgi:hypothetical protein
MRMTFETVSIGKSKIRVPRRLDGHMPPEEFCDAVDAFFADDAPCKPADFDKLGYEGDCMMPQGDRRLSAGYGYGYGVMEETTATPHGDGDHGGECSYYDAGDLTATSAGSCYDMGTHAVTCNVAKDDCAGSWYEPGYVSGHSGCCHCAASCGGEGTMAPPDDHGDHGDQDGMWYCADCNCQDPSDADGHGQAPDGYNQCGGHGDGGDGDCIRAKLTHKMAKAQFKAMCSKCLGMVMDISMNLMSDMEATCDGPVKDFEAGVDCPPDEFDMLGFDNNGEPLTHAGQVESYDCMCTIFPVMFDAAGSTCDDIKAYDDSSCDAGGIAGIGMNECDCECTTDACDGPEECNGGPDGGCPEGKATPYTKESMREQLVMMMKFGGGPDCA